MLDFVIVPDHQTVGGDAKATVTLNRAADAGGQKVDLSSSNLDVAYIQPSVTVPAGQTTVTVDVRAFGEGITQNTLVILEAKINGVGRAHGFQVEPKKN